MKYILLAGFLVSTGLQAQHAPLVCKGIHDEIAEIEAARYGRLHGTQSTMADDDHFDIHYYRAEWEVDPAVRYIKGRVMAAFKMLSASDHISLNLTNALTVSAVTSNGTSLPYTHTGNEITITVNLSAEAADSVTIEYYGIPSNSGYNSFVSSSRTASLPVAGIPVMWTLSEPFGSKDWWPCRNGLNDKADSIDIFIRHPRFFNGTIPYRASSVGLLQSEQVTANGEQVVAYWKHRFPIASYLVAFAVTNYDVFDRTFAVGAHEVLMQTYCYPENRTVFEEGADNTLEMMSFFTQHFGPYPFTSEKYGHTQFGWSGGMEHQTNSFMVNMGEILRAHELAHQWFGNKVTCGNWEDIWLNEGFASYLTSMFMEHKYPDTKISRRVSEIATITNEAGGSVKVNNVTSHTRIFNSRLSYYKGAHLLYMLRWILGDTDFFTAVNNYLNDPSLAFGYATTQDLKNHLETVSQKDLTYFFEQWFEGEGYPSYHLTWFPQGNSVRFSMAQTTSVPASVSFFSLPVPLLFKGSLPGEEKLVVVQHTLNGETFLENLGFEAVSVTIDPEAWLITRNNTVVKSPQALPVVFKDITITCDEGDPTLWWETAEETDVDRFEILFSPDARNWTPAGTVPPSPASRHYLYADTAATGRREGYYRLAQYDKNNEAFYSRIFVTPCKKAPGHDFSLYPNPAGNHMTAGSALFRDTKSTFLIIDALGRVCQSGAFDTGREVHPLDISGLPPGSYHLKITLESTAANLFRRFIKK